MPQKNAMLLTMHQTTDMLVSQYNHSAVSDVTDMLKHKQRSVSMLVHIRNVVHRQKDADVTHQRSVSELKRDV